MKVDANMLAEHIEERSHRFFYPAGDLDVEECALVVKALRALAALDATNIRPTPTIYAGAFDRLPLGALEGNE